MQLILLAFLYVLGAAAELLPRFRKDHGCNCPRPSLERLLPQPVIPWFTLKTTTTYTTTVVTIPVKHFF